MEKTWAEYERTTINYLLKAADTLDAYGKALNNDPKMWQEYQEITDWCHGQANALRSMTSKMFPERNEWTDNVVPLRALPKPEPLPPDRPRCRG